jgi:hypothetical protein
MKNPPSPRGKARALPRQYRKLQFIFPKHNKPGTSVPGLYYFPNHLKRFGSSSAFSALSSASQFWAETVFEISQ